MVGSGGRCRASSWAASRTAVLGAVEVGGGQGRGAGPDVGALHALGGGAGRDDAGGFVDGRLHGGGVGQQAGQGDDLDGLLVGEGQPAAQLLGQLRLFLDVVRDVLGGGGGADGQLGDGLLQFGDLVRRSGKIVAPDVVAVNDAGNQGLGAQRGQGGCGGNGALEDVDVQGVDVGGGEGAELAVQRAVGRGDEQLRALGSSREHLVGAGNGCLDLLVPGCPGQPPGPARRAGPSWRRRRPASRAVRCRPGGRPRGGTAG